MARRRSRRKSRAEEQPAAAPDKPGWRERIKAFFVAVWNWGILLAAIAGAAIFGRMTVGIWATADSLPGAEALLFRLLAGGSAVVAVFLAWQCWRGLRYQWHRRRG